MRNYNQELDELFKEWEEKSKENGHNKFCPDGLMCKGDVYEDNKRSRKEGDENTLWHNNAEKRIMFLCKDPNTGYEIEDIRERNGHIDGRNITASFYKTIAHWLYGLLNIDKEKIIIPKFETLTNEEITDFFDKTSFAYVNCKKEAGTSSISHNELVKHIELYKDFIKEEIEILNPDIIICGSYTDSYGNEILDFVKDNVLPDIERIENGKGAYYSKEKSKVVFNALHPSSRVTLKEKYDYVMNDYEDFLKRHPEFLKPCR
jgi:hypothetical protein